MRRTRLVLCLLAIFSVSACSNGKTINQNDVEFTINRGDAVYKIAKNLKNNGIISDSRAFQKLVVDSGKSKKVQVGLYLIKPDTSYDELLNMFTTGKTFSIKVTLPEGYTMFQIAKVIADKGMGSYDKFLEVCSNKTFIEKYGIPGAPTMEGVLYPDTYFFPKNFKEEDIIKLMSKAFWKVMDEDLMNQIEAKGLTVLKAVTLASIIEREAKSEKGLVSAVFHNRIKQRIGLQSCATVFYACDLIGDTKPREENRLRFKHLRMDSPYNTYQKWGLPPGPISNPGKASLLAAVNPADVDYLYFVAKGDGTHYFSNNLHDHNRAVEKYQRAGRALSGEIKY